VRGAAKPSSAQEQVRATVSVPGGLLGGEGSLRRRAVEWAWQASVGLTGASFRFKGERYRYHVADYNKTWTNERAVELPLALAALRRFAGKRVLEVGNVLSHYVPISHDVVDKYEQAAGVQNVDVMDYFPTTRHDLVLSISTLEHVGWDERPRDPGKALRAIEHLRAHCVAPGGTLLVTFPVGYNDGLDAALREGKLRFQEQGYLRRRGPTRWTEAAWDDVKHLRYDLRWNCATAILVGQDGP
jgi:hypothetical protein